MATMPTTYFQLAVKVTSAMIPTTSHMSPASTGTIGRGGRRPTWASTAGTP